MGRGGGGSRSEGLSTRSAAWNCTGKLGSDASAIRCRKYADHRGAHLGDLDDDTRVRWRELPGGAVEILGHERTLVAVNRVGAAMSVAAAPDGSISARQMARVRHLGELVEVAVRRGRRLRKVGSGWVAAGERFELVSVAPTSAITSSEEVRA